MGDANTGQPADLSDEVVQWRRRALMAELEIANLRNRVRSFIRHGRAVPADVTTYDREAVHADLINLMGLYAHLDD